jgi:hypothetical protein
MTVQLPITLSDAEYRALATIAARQHTQVHALIEAQIRRALTPAVIATALAVEPRALAADEPVRKPTPGELSAEARRQRKAAVREGHARGLNDKQISDEIGFPYSTVYMDRRQMGLPAQGPIGRPRKVVSA